MTDHRVGRTDQYQLNKIINPTCQAHTKSGSQPSIDRYETLRVVIPGAARDLVATKQFNQFAEIAAHLQYPGCMPILDSGQEDGVFFQVMPFMERASSTI